MPHVITGGCLVRLRPSECLVLAGSHLPLEGSRVTKRYQEPGRSWIGWRLILFSHAEGEIFGENYINEDLLFESDISDIHISIHDYPWDVHFFWLTAQCIMGLSTNGWWDFNSSIWLLHGGSLFRSYPQRGGFATSHPRIGWRGNLIWKPAICW